jgi:RNA polymerase sporulation-specific sigma factor
MSELLSLIRSAQDGDEFACRQALEENKGLIWSIVRRYQRRGVEVDDLYQLASIGFIKAVKGYDLTYGTCFSTYAVPKIAGEIRRYLRDQGPLKVSRSIREKGQALFALKEKLCGVLGREPRLSDLAEVSGLTEEEIAVLELSAAIPESLQGENADGLSLESRLGSEAPENGLIEKIALREAISSLPEREKYVILLRFYKDLTQEQTARIIGVSQVQVSRLERRGLAKLRELLADPEDQPHT